MRLPVLTYFNSVRTNDEVKAHGAVILLKRRSSGPCQYLDFSILSALSCSSVMKEREGLRLHRTSIGRCSTYCYCSIVPISQAGS